MANKRKISLRKIFQVLVTLVVSTACVIAISSAAKMEDSKRLTGIDMQVADENRCHFLDKKELLNTITQNKSIDQFSVGAVNIRAMEDTMRTNPWIKDAQVYIDNERVMHVSVTQRIPVARVFEADRSSYYLDTSLNAVPLSDRFTYYTVGVTNVPHLINDSVSAATKASIVKLVRHIEKDTFWNAMVSQIMYDTANGFELMPVLGNHIIILGDTSRLAQKLDNVFLFYKNILNNIGWDKYEILDVRYRGQLVASPALPYKSPVGKTVSNMDWVKNIIEQGARSEGIDSVQKVVKQTELKKQVEKVAVVKTSAVKNTKPSKPVDKNNENKKNTQNMKPNKDHSPNKRRAI